MSGGLFSHQVTATEEEVDRVESERIWWRVRSQLAILFSTDDRSDVSGAVWPLQPSVTRQTKKNPRSPTSREIRFTRYAEDLGDGRPRVAGASALPAHAPSLQGFGKVSLQCSFESCWV